MGALWRSSPYGNPAASVSQLSGHIRQDAPDRYGPAPLWIGRPTSGKMTRMVKTRTFLALAAALVLAAPMMLAASRAYADEVSSSSSSSSSTSRNGNSNTRGNSNSNANQNNNRDQDDARDALRRGRVMPLTAILEIAFKRERGTVLEVELDTEDGVLVYEIELLSESGRKVEMWINARTGEFRRVRYP